MYDEIFSYLACESEFTQHILWVVLSIWSWRQTIMILLFGRTNGPGQLLDGIYGVSNSKLLPCWALWSTLDGHCLVNMELTHCAFDSDSLRRISNRLHFVSHTEQWDLLSGTIYFLDAGLLDCIVVLLEVSVRSTAAVGVPSSSESIISPPLSCSMDILDAGLRDCTDSLLEVSVRNTAAVGFHSSSQSIISSSSGPVAKSRSLDPEAQAPVADKRN
jgi:hypothetical protein